MECNDGCLEFAESNSSPEISVIITGYNRKKYILKAIESALSQDWDKNSYEIIVVRNFKDERIDELSKEHRIINIFMDGTIGEFLYAGIMASRGRIVSFLDDDDLFVPGKLREVYEKFSGDIVYYHNSFIPIDEDGNSVIFTNKSKDFNMSCISIRKDIINIDGLQRINTIQDTFMFLSATESLKAMVSDNLQLTYFRLHQSTTPYFQGNFDDFKLKHDIWSSQTLENLNLFKHIFTSKQGSRYINAYLTDLQILRESWGFSKGVKLLLPYALSKYASFSHRILRIVMLFMLRVAPRISKEYILKKRYDRWKGTLR